MTLHRSTIALLILYVILTIYPIISIVAGVTPSRFITPVTTLAGFTFALLHAGQREGWSGALRLLALVFGVSLLFESVGVATGLIYGAYHYTNRLGPLFLGLVPYLIPVAWFMMSYPSYVIADRLIPAGWKRWQRILSVAAVGGLVMTAWDLVMDPVMVASGHWVWGAERGLPRYPSAELLGVVADRVFNLRPVHVDLQQSLPTKRNEVRPAGGTELPGHRAGHRDALAGYKCGGTGADRILCDDAVGHRRGIEAGKGLTLDNRVSQKQGAENQMTGAGMF
jgi:hypothetical protein